MNKPKAPQIFKPEDFDLEDDYDVHSAARSSVKANEAFQKWLAENGVVVYGNVSKKEAFVPMSCKRYYGFESGNPMVGFNQRNVTHTALLVCIEEIKKECVEHEPTIGMYVDGTYETKNPKCKHCKKPLKAQWTLAEDPAFCEHKNNSLVFVMGTDHVKQIKCVDCGKHLKARLEVNE